MNPTIDRIDHVGLFRDPALASVMRRDPEERIVAERPARERPQRELPIVLR